MTPDLRRVFDYARDDWHRPTMRQVSALVARAVAEAPRARPGATPRRWSAAGVYGDARRHVIQF